MKGKEGCCGLCRKSAELRNSHLLPAALYKFFRNPADGPNSSPIHVTTKKIFSSDKQITEYFLCGRCEQQFAANGESYVLRQCDRQNGTFRLRDLLQGTSVLCDLGEEKVYEVASLLGDKTERYLYFGASVFWRAAARSWMCRGAGVAPINLGHYEEQLRLYLLGEAGFPANGRLFVNVSSNGQTGVTIPPLEGQLTLSTYKGPYYKFYIPGILFTLISNREGASACDSIALNSSRGKFMLLSPWKDDSLFNYAVAGIKLSMRK